MEIPVVHVDVAQDDDLPFFSSPRGDLMIHLRRYGQDGYWTKQIRSNGDNSEWFHMDQCGCP